MLEKESLSVNGLYGCSKSSGDDAEVQGAYAAILFARVPNVGKGDGLLNR